jgi:hypothetical protein
MHVIQTPSVSSNMTCRTGMYKWPTIIAALASMTSFTCLIAVWRGNTKFAQALHVFPAGFSTGVAHSAVFIGLIASVAESDHIAIAGSGLYLSGNLGAVAGSTGSSAVFQLLLERGLREAVAGLPDGQEVRVICCLSRRTY